MKCPKCGYHRQKRDNAFVPATECPACGVVYSKHENQDDKGPVRIATPSVPNLRPSPVDATSLKKARDRVEKRLRKRMESSDKDDRHAQTLKLARRFTEEEIRKRRQQYQEKQLVENTEESPSPENKEKQTDAHEIASEETIHASPETAIEDNQADVVPEKLEVTDGKKLTETQVPDNAEEAEAAAKTSMDRKYDTEAPDSDVSVETIILTSAPPAPSKKDTAPSFDETPTDIYQPEAQPLPPEVEAIEADTMERMPDEEVQPTSASEIPHNALLSQFSGLRQGGNGLVGMLTVVAWLILGAGIIGAVLSWTTISDVEAGMRIPAPDGVNALPLGLLLGFAYLATGVLGFAFFWVSSIISHQLKDIRRLLMLPPDAMTSGQPEEISDDMVDEAPTQA